MTAAGQETEAVTDNVLPDPRTGRCRRYWFKVRDPILQEYCW